MATTSFARYTLQKLGRAFCLAALAAFTFTATAQTAENNTDAPTPAAQSSMVPVAELSTIPAPSVPAKAWMTYDANSGQVIGGLNIEQAVEPASLTKLMTAYIVFSAIEKNRLALDQEVHVSEKAWKTEGSRMFIDPNSKVTVDELLKGMIIQSGNDATVALAEAVAGSESAFVALMNQEADKMGLKNTYYTNASGLPHDDHLTTVSDLGIVAVRLVKDFPQYLHYYSEKEYTYNDIRQMNRNRLLWTDSTVDGLKTGHTSTAGYCLVSTALRDGRRVVSIVVGTESDAARAEISLKLLNWSYQNFDTVKLYDAEKPAVEARVWEGTQETVALGQPEPIWVTVPRGKLADLKADAQYTQPLIAPLESGKRAGTVTLELDGKPLREIPLLILDDVAQAGFFSRLIDKVKMMLQ